MAKKDTYPIIITKHYIFVNSIYLIFNKNSDFFEIKSKLSKKDFFAFAFDKNLFARLFTKRLKCVIIIKMKYSEVQYALVERII